MGIITSLSRIGLVYCGYHTFTHQVADIWLISDGESMEPTLSAGQVVVGLPARSTFWDLSLSCSLSYRLCGRAEQSSIEKLDLVVARNPTDPKHFIIKRVHGLQGDRIPLEHRVRHRFLPAGQTWLEGDNSSGSRDSRTYGPVPLGLVQARVVARLWPPQLF